jgi:hypothetical protein
MQTLFGLNIVESPSRPNYVLPREIIPGISWPPGFRDEINKWSLEFLGTTNFIPENTIYFLNPASIIMRPEDIVKIINTYT